MFSFPSARILSRQRYEKTCFADLLADTSSELVIAGTVFLRDENSPTELVLQQFHTAVKLMGHKFVSDGPILAADHVGGWLRLIALQDPNVFIQVPFSEESVDRFIKKLKDALARKIDERYVRDFEIFLERLSSRLTKDARETVRALFIGDCLVWDIATQLQILAHGLEFDIEVTINAKRLGLDLRRSIRQYSTDQFDLIFYSPFSFGFSDEYSQFGSPTRMFKAMSNRRTAVQYAIDDAFKTIELLQQYFEGSVYVHTVSGIRQNTPGLRGWFGDLLTYPTRRWVSFHLNSRLSNCINAIGRVSNKSILRIDEDSPLSRKSARALGQVIYDAGELHPTALAQELARGPYLRACQAIARFKNKKLIVCDLDNTLWEGVIGDGSVDQHSDRQTALQRIKAKGVLLAVSSKNDPVNVRWELTAMSSDDFVALEINWGRKASNIRRIAETLNLNPDSFVFLDDRPDERATVTEELPGILALDPNESLTWELIEEWTKLLKNSALTDRTEIYKERFARQSYLESHEGGTDEIHEAYRKLDLRLILRHPMRTDIERVVELINRTNQFNTTAARTTISEITTPESHRHIVVAEARDKFGEMGIIGILVVTVDKGFWITHFVLSCRVFGFGIEDAMVQSVLHSFQNKRINAVLVKTPVNGPCQKVYEKNGFNIEGEFWVSPNSNVAKFPDWLSVENRCEVFV